LVAKSGADEAILRHYHNRGILPFEIATNLSAEEYDAAKAHLPPEMKLRGVYLRFIHRAKLQGKIVWLHRRTGRNPDGSLTITKQFGRRRKDVKESNKPSTPCSRQAWRV